MSFWRSLRAKVKSVWCNFFPVRSVENTTTIVVPVVVVPDDDPSMKRAAVAEGELRRIQHILNEVDVKVTFGRRLEGYEGDASSSD